MTDWPGSLPTTLIMDGLQHSAQPKIIANEPDTGPTLKRRRFTAASEYFTGYMWMTYTQYGTAKTFFDTTLNGGLDAFNFTHPISGATVSVRFMAEKGASMIIAGFGGAKLRIQLEIEVLP